MPGATQANVSNLSANAVSVGGVNCPAGSITNVSLPGGLLAQANASKWADLLSLHRNGQITVTF